MKSNKVRLVAFALLAVAMLAFAGTVLAQDATPPPGNGTLDLTCGISNVNEGEAVACQVTIDAAPQPDIPAGQMVSFPLPLGDHTVVVTAAGAQAANWEPASVEKVVSITSTTTSKKFTAKFLKKGHLVVNLKQEGVTADFYVDKTLVGPQAVSIEVWLTPNKNHTIAVKNVVDPAANGVYGWFDTSQSVFTTAASDKTLTINLTKKPIKGFIKVKCALPNAQPTDVVVCRPTLDTVVQADMAAGSEVIYTLDKGSHTVQVDLVGDSAYLWAPQTRSKTISVFAGKTATYTPVFTKSGHMIVTLDQPGVVADFYLDGVQVAAQVPGFDAWVTPNSGHKVEAKNVFDPAAQGFYHWKDASSTASVASGAEKSVVIKLVKVVTSGTLAVKCEISNVPPPSVAPAYCIVFVDGGFLGTIAPNTTSFFTVVEGTHNVRISMGPEDVWEGSDWNYTVTINVNQTSNVWGGFNLSW